MSKISTALRTFVRSAQVSLARVLVTSVVGFSTLLCSSSMFAAEPQSVVVSAQAGLLKGSVAPVVRAASDLGPIEAGTRIPRLTLHFSMTAAQKADLASLLRDQQDSTSPLFHHWLTPAEYKERFGRTPAEVATAAAWLEGHGFTVVESTPLRVSFSGTASQVDSAFSTNMHRYTLGGRSFYSNSTDIRLPASLARFVSSVGNLNSLRPTPNHHAKKPVSYTPNLTDSSGNHYLVAADIQTIYDVNALYAAGYTGAGQTLVVVGQSEIDTTDLDSFHASFGGNTNLIITLVPGTGDSAVTSALDQEESDLDIEYSGSLAKDAVVNFVYSGNDGVSDVFDAVQYAVENELAPVISISYGACEAEMDSFTVESLTNTFDEANAQGQSLVAASGDSGATACDRGNVTASQGLSVQFPSDAPEVTGIGGTEFNDASGSYWSTTNLHPGDGSALGYIPEIVWNDSDSSGLNAGGGGVSTLFTKPLWQVGVGVPNDGSRDIPDLSLDASGTHDPYIFCGPADSDGNNCSDGYVYQDGGTSFGAPIFSGILTLINQAAGSTGLGNINPLLYPMVTAAPAAFHDIVTGNNDSPCVSGSTDCPVGTTEIGYSAGPGYDLATGLGSIDTLPFAQAFPGYGSGVSLAASSTTLSYSPIVPDAGVSITFTATVASTTAGNPSGSVQLSIDGNVVSQSTLTSGAIGYVSSPLSAGSHSITAIYSGDGFYAGSAGSATPNVAPLPLTSTTMSISPTAPTTATALTIAVKVASPTAGTPTGTIDLVIDGNDTNNPVTIASGATSLTLPALSAGAHLITAQYSGDSKYAPSTGLIGFTVSLVNSDTVKVSISPSTPSINDMVTITAAATAGATGSVQFLMDGIAAGGPITLTSTGVASASIGKLAAGNHTLTANYLGDLAFAPSVGSLPFIVTSPSDAFTLSATNLTLSENQSGNSTVTVTSKTDYAGTVNLAVSGTGPTDACFLVNSNPTVGAESTTTALIAVFTGSNCQAVPNAKHFASLSVIPPPSSRFPLLPVSFAGAAGMLLFGLRRRVRSCKLIVWMLVLGAAGMTVGCGSSGSTISPTTGTYTFTVTGTDATTANNKASTNFTVTIQ